MTATDLAAVAGYRNDRGTNLQYGKMSQLLADRLGFTDSERMSTVVSLFYAPQSIDNAEWLLKMRDEVAQALEELGWFRSA